MSASGGKEREQQAYIRQKRDPDSVRGELLQRGRAVQQAAVERHVLQGGGEADPGAADIAALDLSVLRVCSAVQHDGGRSVTRQVRDGGYLFTGHMCREGRSTGQGDLRVYVDANVVDQRLVCKKSKMPCNATTARWQPVQRHNRTLAAHLCPSETRCSASVASDVAHNTRHTLHADTWLLPCLT